MKVRQPIVSGRFYPDSAYELSSVLDEYFSNTLKNIRSKAKAIISPHAGFVYSGQVAANAFSAIDPNNEYKNVFILGSSHHYAFKGAVFPKEDYFSTPLGEIELNRDLLLTLEQTCDFFFPMPEAHSQEHSIEVQLPFLQFWLKHQYKIVPILIGTQNPEVLHNIAQNLSTYWKDKSNLFIFSTDFSHYPNYQTAIECDNAVAKAIESNSIETFQKTLEHYDKINNPNLHTCICGASIVKTLLYILENNSTFSINKLYYQNSGDSVWGDKERVVGYWAMGVFDSDTN